MVNMQRNYQKMGIGFVDGVLDIIYESERLKV